MKTPAKFGEVVCHVDYALLAPVRRALNHTAQDSHVSFRFINH